MPIEDYAATAVARRQHIQGYSGTQPGDPVRAAQAIIQAVSSPNPPLHLLLGKPAYEAVTAKLKGMLTEIFLLTHPHSFPK